MLNHSTGFDRELDARIEDFYDRVVEQIQRSLDLGIEMNLVRRCDTRAAAYCILGVVKEVVSHLSRERRADITRPGGRDSRIWLARSGAAGIAGRAAIRGRHTAMAAAFFLGLN